MDAQQFLAAFGYIANAPGGVARLREMVLDLAVHGRLVEQCDTDDSVTAWLNHVSTQKADLIAKKQIPKQTVLGELADEEHPFALPKGWVFVRLGQIANKIGSGSTPKGGREVYVDEGIPFLRSQNVWNDGLHLDDVAYITAAEHERMSGTKVLGQDILLNITGASLGRCALVPSDFGEANVSQHVTIIRLTDPEIRHYIHLCILSPYTQSMIWGRQVGMAREGLSKKVLEQFEIPLPPIQEQQRILAKVDELMALCDRLEAQQQARRKLQNALRQSTLQAMASATSPHELQEGWKRLRDSLGDLFTEPGDVAGLREMVRALAIQGRLVAQNPNDKHASDLLCEISANKQKMISSGQLRREMPWPQVSKQEAPFQVPEGWVWVRFGEVTINRDGERVPVSSVDRANVEKLYDYYGASGAIDKINDFIFDKTLLLVGEDGANLINRSTPIAFLAHGKYWVNNHAHVIDATHRELLDYLKLFLNSISLEPYVTGTAQPKLNQAKLNNIPVAMPPLAEQSRIVAKVDELMALCDRLEQQLQQAQTVAQQYAHAALSRLTHDAPEDAA